VSHSQSQQMEITCPACSSKFTTDIWLVIDVWERPDLVEMLQRGVLHFFTCPSCAKQIVTDTPLLVFRPYTEPPFLLSVPPGTKKRKTRQYASSLLSQLRESMADEWDDAWIAARSVKAIDRTELRVLMNLDLVLIGRQMIDAEEREAAFQRGEIHPHIMALWQLMEADTWVESQRVVEANPDLLSDDVAKLLDEVIGTSRQREDHQAAAIFGQTKQFLERCREVGAEAAAHEFETR